MTARASSGIAISSVMLVALLFLGNGRAVSGETVVAKSDIATLELDLTQIPETKSNERGDRGIEIVLKPNGVSKPIVILPGESTTLTCDPTGGSGEYVAFEWTGPDGVFSTQQNPGVITPDDEGRIVYTVQVTDSFGTIATEIVQIFVADEDDILKDKDAKLSKASYRVSSASYPANPRDVVKLIYRFNDFEDPLLKDGDRLALEFNAMPIGNITKGNGMNLGGKLRRSGPFGVEPYNFDRSRFRYWKRAGVKRQLVIRMRQGVFPTPTPGAPVVLDDTGISDPIRISLIIDRANPDKLIDAVVILEIPFKVDVQRINGFRVEKGRWHRYEIGR